MKISLSGVVVLLFLGVAFFSGLRHVQATLNELPNPILERTESDAFTKLLGLESALQKAVAKGIKYAMPFMLSLAREVDLSDDCMASLIKTLNAVKDLRLWTFQMLDSVGKLESGILQGTLSTLGEYDQCLDTHEPLSKYNEHGRVKGQYCLLSFRPPLPPKPRHVRVYEPVFRSFNATFKTELMNKFSQLLFGFYDTSLRWGVCIPSKCSKSDLQRVLSFVLRPLNISSEINSCEVKEAPTLDAVQISVVIIFGLILFINITGTIGSSLWDERPKNGKGFGLISVFSIKRNFLLAIRNKPGASHLEFLNGIRFLSMTWVILGHCYIMAEKSLLRNPLNVDNFRKDILFEPGSNTYLSVDSFIYLGGTVMAFSLLRTFKDIKISPFVVVGCRLLRVLPCLLVAIGIAFVLPLMGSGPFWKSYTENIAETCRTNWWTNVLLINNFFKFEEMCLIHTWYIPVDFQCFLLGLVYLYIFSKRQIFGKLFLLLLVFISILSTGLVTYIFEYPPTILLGTLMLTDFKFGSQYMRLSYTATHVHISVYAIGLFAGTLIARNPKYKMPIWTSVTGWLTATICGLATVYGTHEWNSGTPYGETEAVIYSSLYRTVWAACLAWITISCYYGRGGIVNYILSFSVYKPLCRLSYLTYLLQYFFVYGYVASRRGPVDYNHSTVTYYFFGVLCLSTMAAFIFYVLVESPIAELTKFVMFKLRDRKFKDEKNNQSCQNGSITTKDISPEKEDPHCKPEISRL